MSKNKGKQEQESLKAQSDAAMAKAGQADPFEEAARAEVTRWSDWRSGKLGPIDVRNMPDSEHAFALLRDSKKVHDEGRIGKGYGSLSENVNPTFVKRLNSEMQFERDMNASGQLEDYIMNKDATVDAKRMGLASVANNRNMSLAQMANQRWSSYVNRPQQPSFLKQLALGALGNFKLPFNNNNSIGKNLAAPATAHEFLHTI